MITKEVELEQDDYGEDASQEYINERILAKLAKWETATVLDFIEAPKTEETPVANKTTANLIRAKGLLAFNIIKHSIIHPNETTVISKETGRLIE